MPKVVWKKLGMDYTAGMPVAEFEIETESLFNLKELYKRVYDWLLFEDYRNIQYDDHENYETLYWEHLYNDGHKEHHIWWRAYKIPQKDLDTDFLLYFFRINYQTIRTRNAEVMFRGKKWAVNDANFVIRCSTHLMIKDLDWGKRDELFNSFLGSIQPRFRHWLYKDKIEFHRKYLYDKTYELQNVIKEFLGESTHVELPPNIYKEKGLG